MKKITVGFVVQDYNENGECTGQEFVAGDQVDWEDENGDIIVPPQNEAYQPFEMVQPTHICYPPVFNKNK